MPPAAEPKALRELTGAHAEAARANVQPIWNACVGTLAILDPAVVHATHRHDGAEALKDMNVSPAAASDAVAASEASCL